MGRRKAGLRRHQAHAYAKGLALAALLAEHNDVFSEIRQDFERAGVIQFEEQVLRMTKEFMLQSPPKCRQHEQTTLMQLNWRSSANLRRDDCRSRRPAAI